MSASGPSGPLVQATVSCLLFPHCCAMSTFSALLQHFSFFHMLPHVSPFSTLLRPVYFFHDHVYFSVLLYHVYLFHAPMLCLLFYTVAPCLIFSCCCTVTPFSTLLHHVYCFHQAAPCLLFHTAVSCLLFQRMCHVFFLRCCAVSTFPHCCASSTFPRFCDMSHLSTRLCHV